METTNPDKRRNQANRAARLGNVVHSHARDMASAQYGRLGFDRQKLHAENLRTFLVILRGGHGEAMAEDLWKTLMSLAGLNPSVGDHQPSLETRAILLANLDNDLTNLEGDNR